MMVVHRKLAHLDELMIPVLILRIGFLSRFKEFISDYVLNSSSIKVILFVIDYYIQTQITCWKVNAKTCFYSIFYVFVELNGSL